MEGGQLVSHLPAVIVPEGLRRVIGCERYGKNRGHLFEIKSAWFTAGYVGVDLIALRVAQLAVIVKDQFLFECFASRYGRFILLSHTGLLGEFRQALPERRDRPVKMNLYGTFGGLHHLSDFTDRESFMVSQYERGSLFRWQRLQRRAYLT